MRILGEGGADAPSSGQDGSGGAGRRTSRFRPVRHFPSHSLQGTAVKSACTGRRGPHKESRTPSSQENAGAGPRAQRHRANPQHGSAHGRTAGAHPFCRWDVHPTGPPAGVWAPPAGRTAAAPRAYRRSWSPGSRGRSGSALRHGRFPGTAYVALNAFYARPSRGGRFSANFLPSGPRCAPGALTPVPPAVLRCGGTRLVVSGARVTRGVLPSELRE